MIMIKRSCVVLCLCMVLSTGLLKEGLKDPRFRHHKILLIQHDARGSAGLVLDRESRLPLASVLGKESPLARDKSLAYGGPVEPKTLLALVKVRHFPPEPSDHVVRDIYATGAYVLEDWEDFSKEVIEYRIFAGYAGWAQGQLQAEVQRGDWQLLEADLKVIFPEQEDAPQ